MTITRNDEFYHAVVDTRSFTFDAFGLSERDCYEQIEDAWRVHVKQTGADPEYINRFRDGISICKVRIGSVLRDRETLIR